VVSSYGSQPVEGDLTVGMVAISDTANNHIGLCGKSG
jgi:hypothetical protein